MTSTDNSSDLTARFSQLWQQIQRHNASLFLRHALRLDMTLEQVLLALKFEGSGELAKGLRLGDLLAAQLQAKAEGSDVSAARGGASARASTRRRRRGPEEMAQLKEAILERLRAAMGSVTTTHLCDVLTNGGFDVDLLQMNRALTALEQEGYLINLGGKPKAWRLKPQGRMAPEPMVVRRAGQAPEPKPTDS